MKNWQLETLKSRVEWHKCVINTSEDQKIADKHKKRLEFIAEHVERRLKRVDGLIEIAHKQKTSSTMDLYQNTKCELLDLQERIGN